MKKLTPIAAALALTACTAGELVETTLGAAIAGVQLFVPLPFGGAALGLIPTDFTECRQSTPENKSCQTAAPGL